MNNKGTKSASLAECLIKKLGNKAPSKEHIKLMETLLSSTGIVTKKLFDERLTKREMECLALATLGETSVSTAKILKISRKTVDQYKHNLKKKLESRNMTEAAIKGIKYGYFNQFD